MPPTQEPAVQQVGMFGKRSVSIRIGLILQPRIGHRGDNLMNTRGRKLRNQLRRAVLKVAWPRAATHDRESA